MSVWQNGEDLSLVGSMLDGSFEALRLNCDTRIDAFGFDRFKQRLFPFVISLVKFGAFSDEQIHDANMTSLSGVTTNSSRRSTADIGPSHTAHRSARPGSAP